MSYLLLICSIFSMVLQNSLFNSVSKKYLKEKGDVYYYNSFLYLVCIVLFGIMAVGKGISAYTVVLGIIFGVITMLSNFYKMSALAQGPMHITILITTASMIIPTMSGVILFDEAFSGLKLIAVLVLIFFIYLSLDKGDNKEINKKWLLYCILAFLFQGTIGILQKLHQSSVHKDELFTFLATSFMCSFLFAGLFARREKRSFHFGKKQYIFALICGVCTFAMNFLNLKLAGILPSQLFFPVVNGSAIIFSSLSSVIIFREKVTKRQVVGLIGGLAALIGICIL